MTKNDDRQDVSQDHVYDDPGSERDKRPDTRIGQFTESRRQSDTQETKGERPGPQGSDRRDEGGLHHFIVIGQRISVDDDRGEYGRDEKSDDEFGKAPPDLADLDGRIGFGAFPISDRDERQYKRPDPDPNIPANHFDQRIGCQGLIGRSRDTQPLPCQLAVL